MHQDAVFKQNASQCFDHAGTHLRVQSVFIGSAQERKD